MRWWLICKTIPGGDLFVRLFEVVTYLWEELRWWIIWKKEVIFKNIHAYYSYQRIYYLSDNWLGSIYESNHLFFILTFEMRIPIKRFLWLEVLTSDTFWYSCFRLFLESCDRVIRSHGNLKFLKINNVFLLRVVF